MADQTETYELIVWDFDGAPDGCGYYVCCRRRGLDRRMAIALAYDKAGDHEDAMACGAGIYLDGVLVKGYGLTLEYPNT
jgi:hypothetical protein